MNFDDLLYEIDSLFKLHNKCIENFENEQYGRYYMDCSHEIDEIMPWLQVFEYPNSIKTHEDYMSFIKKIDPNSITKEQKESIKIGRSLYSFKYLMGQISLENREELESLIGKTITYKGIIVEDEDGRQRQAVKTTEQLRKERQEYDDILSSLYSTKAINTEQYRKYSRALFYIYNYFESISRGEQVRFRKWTNADYAVMEQKAHKEGFYGLNYFNDFMKEYNEEARKFFEDTQYLQDVALESQSDIIRK